MAYSLFPAGDSKKLQWSQALITGLTDAGSESYGITTAALAAYTAVSDAFGTALAASAPTFRTKATTSAKNAARDDLLRSAKLLVNTINGQANVTDSMKLAIGIPVRKEPSPSPLIETAPNIQIVSMLGRIVNGTLSDNSVGKKRRAPGAAGATLFSFIGATPPSSIEQFKFEGNITSTKFKLVFPPTVPAGSTIFVTAFWRNARDIAGPAAQPVGFQIGGGVSNVTGT